MTIDTPTSQVPMIPEPPLGVSREILGDPCGRDGGGGGQKIRARKEDRRGNGHARHAAEKPDTWIKNRCDGTWRRSGEVPGPAVSAKDVFWRPWEEEQAEPVHTIVSIAHPSHKHPVYFASTDIRTRSDLNKGKESLD